MSRTVVPAAPVLNAGGLGTKLRLAGGDDLPTKLVKYVPAETLAFFVPIAATIDKGDNSTLLAVLATAVIGTVGWLWFKGSQETAEKRPLPHFYVLAVLSFGVWAISTAPNVAALAGISTKRAGVLLGIGVFLIPLADGLLTSRAPRRAAVTTGTVT